MAGVGEALVSVLGEGGVPSQVERTLVRPPSSRMGPVSDTERAAVIKTNPLDRLYQREEDPRSAHEILTERAAKRQQAMQAEAERDKADKAKGRSSNRQTAGEAFVKSVVRSVGSSVGRSLGRKLLRGVLGSLLGGK